MKCPASGMDVPRVSAMSESTPIMENSDMHMPNVPNAMAARLLETGLMLTIPLPEAGENSPV